MQTNFCRLTALTTKDEDKKKSVFLTRINKSIINPEELIEKMKVKQEQETPIGKADANSAARALDKPLFHVFTNLMKLQLDSKHARIQDILVKSEDNMWNVSTSFF